MKRHYLILLFLGLLATGCNNNGGQNENGNGKTDSASKPAINNAPVAYPAMGDTSGRAANAPAKDAMIPATGSSRWIQTEQDDIKVHKKLYHATISASQALHFKSGNVDAQLMLTNKNGINEAVLRLNSGNFSKNAGNTSLEAVFDSSSTMKLSSEVSGYMANCIIIKDADKLISKIKTTRRVVINADVENEGPQKIIFDVAGLDWKH